MSEYEKDAISVLAHFNSGETPLPDIVVVGMGKLRRRWWQQEKMFCCKVDPFTFQKLNKTLECTTIALSVCINAIFTVRKSIIDMIDWFVANCRTAQQKQMSLCRMLFPHQLNNMMIMMWITRNHATVSHRLLSHLEDVVPIQRKVFSELNVKGRIRWRDLFFPTFLYSVREPMEKYICRICKYLQ